MRRIDENALARLSTYAWPGNVRELENAIEQALVFASGDSIDVASLPAFLREGASEATLALPEHQHEPARDSRRSRAAAHPARLRPHRWREDRDRAPARHQDLALYYKLEKYGIGSTAGRPSGTPKG